LEPPLIVLDRVTKRFANGTQALDGIDLELRQGEFLTLLGPSGCGKSTVLRLVAGLSAASTGRITRHGAVSVGFVFQEPTLMPWARVLDNVRLPLALRHVPRREAIHRAEAALALVGLAGFARHYPRELSGGMRMRVSIARALVTRPRVLLMDEPFAALDEITRLRLDDELLALWQAQGTTILFVTHSVFESVYLSSRIAVFTGRPGRIAETIEIDGPLPRADFRLSPAYAGFCATVSAALDRAAAISP
jgi:NitT/TauT family transport system ATP-binding protein